jgi:hypothetical protein
MTSASDDPYLRQDLIDPVCFTHGLPWSTNPPHWAGRCLVCVLCFKVLSSTNDCNPIGDGKFEDVCVKCAEAEKLTIKRDTQ